MIDCTEEIIDGVIRGILGFRDVTLSRNVQNSTRKTRFRGESRPAIYKGNAGC